MSNQNALHLNFENEFLFHFKSFQSWAFFEQISQRVNVLEHFTKKWQKLQSLHTFSLEKYFDFFYQKRFLSVCEKMPSIWAQLPYFIFHFFLFFSYDWSEIWFLLGGKNVNQIHLTYPLTTFLVTDKDYEYFPSMKDSDKTANRISTNSPKEFWIIEKSSCFWVSSSSFKRLLESKTVNFLNKT